jgi:O-antigen/teichoic acid export membrane protein
MLSPHARARRDDRAATYPPGTVSRRRWLGRSVWTIADQIAFSGSNLVLNILLARWLPTSEYGVFSVAFAVFLLIGAVHSTFLIEPMMVFGPGQYRERGLEYLRGLLGLHWRVTAPVAVLGATALLLTWLAHWPFGSLLFSAGVAVPAVLMSWLIRRAFYVADRIDLGAVCGLVYAMIVIVCIVGLRRAQLLTPATAFATLALAGMGSALLSMRFLGLTSAGGKIATSEIVATHAPYSRWAIASSVFMWIPMNALIVALPLVAGINASAGLRAALNVVAPAQTVWTALGLMLLPQLVRSGRGADLVLVRNALKLSVLVGVVAWIVLIAMPHSVMHLLYHGRYDDESSLLYILGAFPLVAGIEVTLEMLFRARQSPRSVFVAWVAASSIVIPAGIVATIWFGPTAAAVAIVTTFAVAALLLSRQVLIRQTADRTPA